MAFATVGTILVTWALQNSGISFGFMPTAILAMPIAVIACLVYILLIDKFVYEY